MATETCTVMPGVVRGENEALVSDRRNYWVQKWQELEEGGKARLRVIPPMMYSSAMFAHSPDKHKLWEEMRRDGRSQEEFWKSQWEGISEMPPELREKWETMRKDGHTEAFWREQMREWVRNGKKEEDIPPWLPSVIREKWVEIGQRSGFPEKWAEMEKRGDRFWKRFHGEWKEGEEQRERFFGKLWHNRQQENGPEVPEGETESGKSRWRGCSWRHGNCKRGPGCWRGRENEGRQDEKMTRTEEKQVYKEFDMFDY